MGAGFFAASPGFRAAATGAGVVIATRGLGFGATGVGFGFVFGSAFVTWRAGWAFFAATAGWLFLLALAERTSGMLGLFAAAWTRPLGPSLAAEPRGAFEDFAIVQLPLSL